MRDLKNYGKGEEAEFFHAMSDFINIYKDIYDFSKVKIDSELGIILKYYNAKKGKFNVKSIDLVDDALKY